MPSSTTAMKTAIAQFLNHLSHERRLSDHTCKAYTTDLDQFAAFLQTCDISHPQQIDRNAVRGFLGFLHNRGFGRRSVARKLAAVRTFLSYLCALSDTDGMGLDQNPALNVHPPRQDKILPVYIDVEEVARAMSIPSPNTVLDCATGRSWSCFTARAFACANSRVSKQTRWTWPTNWCALSARATTSGWCRLANRPESRWWRIWRDGGN